MVQQAQYDKEIWKEVVKLLRSYTVRCKQHLFCIFLLYTTKVDLSDLLKSNLSMQAKNKIIRLK